MNGIPIGSAASATSCTDTYCTIASTVDYRDATTTYKFAGYLSDVRVVNGTALYTATFAPTYQPLTAVANTSLLTLQNNGGATNGGFADNGEFQNVITRVGNASQGTFSPYSQMGWSNLFNGSTDYLTFPSSSALTGIANTNMTIEFWVNFTSGVSSNLLNVVQKGRTGNSDYEWGVYLTGSTGTAGGMVISWQPQTGGSGSNNNTYNSSGVTMTVGVWYHVAIAVSGTTAYFFLNGAAAGTSSISLSSFTSSGVLSIANNNAGSNNFQACYISNLRILKGTALYTSAFTSPSAPLTAIANTVLLTCQSNRFVDNSTTGSKFTAVGNPSAQAFTPFSPGAVYSPTVNGGSAYFNGSTDAISLPSMPISTTGNFTVEAWVYPTSGSDGGIFFLGGNTSSYAGLRFGFSSGASPSGFYLLHSQNGTSWAVNLAVGGYILNAWTHVAIVRNGTAGTIYLNGVSAGTFSWGTLYAGTSNLIGEYLNSTNYFFTGYITDVRITPGTAVYTTAFTPPTAPLTNYANSTPATLLLNFNNGGIVDQHSSFNFATVGNIQTSTSTVKYGTRSLQFTGTSGAYLQSFQSLPALQWWLGSYTVEYWIYANAFTTGGNGESTVLGCLGATGTSTYWAFGPIAGGTVRWYYYNGSAQTLTTSTTLSTGQWYHLAFVNNAGALTIYINGVSSATGTISGTPQAVATLPVTLGSSNNVSFNGYLDDVRITKYARYTGNFTPPTISDIAQ